MECYPAAGDDLDAIWAVSYCHFAVEMRGLDQISGENHIALIECFLVRSSRVVDPLFIDLLVLVCKRVDDVHRIGGDIVNIHLGVFFSSGQTGDETTNEVVVAVPLGIKLLFSDS